MSKESQKTKILKHLEEGKPITPIDALDLYGCFRLSDVIFKLKQEGHDIQTNMVENQNGKKFASYTLMSKDGEFNFGKVVSLRYPD